MSQQLNLLPAEKFGINPAMMALLVLGAILLGLSAIWGINHFRFLALQEKVATAEADLRQTEAALQERIDAKAALVAQIAANRPLAVAAKELTQLIEGVGNPAGFSGYLSTLADATEDGLWLTRVNLANYHVTQVDGQSLSSEAVLRFSRGLNTLFAEQKIQFSTLELTPVTAAAVGRPPLSSTKFVIR